MAAAKNLSYLLLLVLNKNMQSDWARRLRGARPQNRYMRYLALGSPINESFLKATLNKTPRIKGKYKCLSVGRSCFIKVMIPY